MLLQGHLTVNWASLLQRAWKVCNKQDSVSHAHVLHQIYCLQYYKRCPVSWTRGLKELNIKKQSEIYCGVIPRNVNTYRLEMSLK